MTAPGHPTPQALADALAGAPEGDPASLQHLEGCADCQQVADALARVSAELRALPPVSVPGDVADRLDAALRGAAGSGSAQVLPLTAARRRPPRWLAAAAAVALTAGAVTTAIVATRGDSRPDGAGGLTAAGEPRVAQSGFDYQPGNLAAAVPSLVGGGSPVAAAGGAESADRSASAPVPTSEAPKALAQTDAAALQSLADPAALAACLVRALGVDSGTPRAVDLASFQGAPAVIAAYDAEGKPGRLDVYVLGPDCAPDAFLYFARVSAPAP